MKNKLKRIAIVTLVVGAFVGYAAMYKAPEVEYEQKDLDIIKEYIMTKNNENIRSYHDYNNDDVVDSKDYVLIKKEELGLVDYCAYDLVIIQDYIMTGADTYLTESHDYNGDGQVRANDYLMIKDLEL